MVRVGVRVTGAVPAETGPSGLRIVDPGVRSNFNVVQLARASSHSYAIGENAAAGDNSQLKHLFDSDPNTASILAIEVGCVHRRLFHRRYAVSESALHCRALLLFGGYTESTTPLTIITVVLGTFVRRSMLLYVLSARVCGENMKTSIKNGPSVSIQQPDRLPVERVR